MYNTVEFISRQNAVHVVGSPVLTMSDDVPGHVVL